MKNVSVKTFKKVVPFLLFLLIKSNVIAQIPPDQPCPTRIIVPGNYTVDDLVNDPDFYGLVSLVYDPLSLSTVYTLQVSSSIVLFQGLFFVNQPFQILSTNAVFELGAGIRVVPSNKQNIPDGKLILTESLLEGCETMWEGINLTTGTTSLRMTDSEVRDAEIAVLSNSGAHFDIKYSVFDANYVGIKMPEYYGEHTGTVIGSTFKASKFLLPPRSGSRAYAGVLLDGVIDLSTSKGFTLGDNSIQSFKNYFFGNDYSIPIQPGLLFGIKSDKSSVKIINNEFRGFVSIDVIDPNTKAAVYIDGISQIGTFSPITVPVVTIGGNDTYERNFFYDSNENIRLFGIQKSKVINNFFSGFYQFTNSTNAVAIGGRDNTHALGELLIENNDINDNLQTGISLSNYFTNDVIIKNNSINLEDAYRTIGIYNDNIHPGATYDLLSNVIDDACIGIKVINSSGAHIVENIIDLKTNTYLFNALNTGIDISNTFNFEGNRNVEVWNNQIIGDNTIAPAYCKQTGIRVSMSGHDAMVSCNEISYTTTSIHYLGINTEGDDSFILGNTMSQADYGFVASNGTELANIGLITFPSDNQWDFIPIHTYTENANGQFTRFWTRNGGLPFEPWNNLSLNPIEEIIVDPNANGNFYDCDDVFVPPFQRLASNITTPKMKRSTIFLSENWLKNYGFFKTLYSTKSRLNTVSINYLDSLKSTSIGSAILTQNNGDSLSKYRNVSTNFMEDNLLFAYSIRENLLYSKQPTLSKMDYYRMDTIAKSCPFVVGPSVYEARSILFELYGIEYYNQCEEIIGKENYENGKGARLRSEPIREESILDIDVFPNPATDLLTIETTSENVQYQFFDSFGKLVKLGNIQFGRNEISVKELIPGIYFLMVSSENKNVFTKKVNIK